jgi:hypothetical protein
VPPLDPEPLPLVDPAPALAPLLDPEVLPVVAPAPAPALEPEALPVVDPAPVVAPLPDPEALPVMSPASVLAPLPDPEPLALPLAVRAGIGIVDPLLGSTTVRAVMAPCGGGAEITLVFALDTETLAGLAQ